MAVGNPDDIGGVCGVASCLGNRAMPEAGEAVEVNNPRNSKRKPQSIFFCEKAACVSRKVGDWKMQDRS